MLNCSFHWNMIRNFLFAISGENREPFQWKLLKNTSQGGNNYLGFERPQFILVLKWKKQAQICSVLFCKDRIINYDYYINICTLNHFFAFHQMFC